MSYQNLLLVLSFAVSFLVAFAATPLAKVIAHKIGAIDVPKDERRVHKQPIPRLGGLAIFYGFIVSVLSFIEFDTGVKGILLGALVIVLLGIIDDVYQLKARLKLVIQIAAALIVAFYGVKIEFLTNPNIFSSQPTIPLGYFALPVTVMWIVGITNAVNLIDGLDGLAAGISSIASISLLFISLLASESSVAILTAALAGSCLGFLPYNFNPAKIFMGDTGATFLGFILATVSIQGLFKGYAVITFAVPLLILGLPIFDTGYAILRRLLSGKSIMEADRGHLHHRLIDMGFSQKQTVMILYTISGILGLSAVVLAGSGALSAMILILSVLVFVVAGAKYMYTPISELAKSGDNESTQE
ncbi:MAG: UDP-GlcNAc:undecaprenyl-phosphate/decaprenyl-phosphate GlcNAc-phosphate transferase [Petroclostridium sp.]|nr:undecaprenyl-phosphate alpha-N-acetylglucosaminyl 1-phosphate transferase [Clostridia bacterium]MDK2811621.1 UDP-GlcNAc:undecaprenyl-phosphate/decaprenyl-phosphate GlcNAc-phosphate transferase [Petroclostridium sp.]